MEKNTQIAINKQKELLEHIKQYQAMQLIENKKVQFGSDISKQNELLVESISNLFDLIPEQITLNKIQMEKYQLNLYGTTPSKQVYTFLLEVPLRSIFNQSRADFYMLPNGWYNFVSISKLQKEE